MLPVRVELIQSHMNVDIMYRIHMCVGARVRVWHECEQRC